MAEELVEITILGRGGQGAVTTAELMAVAAYKNGKEAQAFPYFGVERRGAPVRAFCRISEKHIKLHQHIYHPKMIIVLDDSLLSNTSMFDKLADGGMIIVASKKKPEELKKELAALKNKYKLYSVDAYSIAREEIGKPIVNTALLGAFAKITKLVKVENLKEAVMERFKEPIASKNAKALQRCYDAA